MGIWGSSLYRGTRPTNRGTLSVCCCCSATNPPYISPEGSVCGRSLRLVAPPVLRQLLVMTSHVPWCRGASRQASLNGFVAVFCMLGAYPLWPSMVYFPAWLSPSTFHFGWTTDGALSGLVFARYSPSQLLPLTPALKCLVHLLDFIATPSHHHALVSREA